MNLFELLCRFSPSAVGELIPLLGSVDVTLGPGGPEDGSHVLHFAFGMGAHGPGERAPGKHTTTGGDEIIPPTGL